MKTFVNLLPLEYRRRQLVRCRLVQWSVVWALCVLLAAGVWWGKQCRHRSARYAAEAAERAYLPLKKLLGESDAMRTELEQLHAKGTILRQLCDDRPIVTLIGVVSQGVHQCAGRLAVQKLSFERREEQIPTGAVKSAARNKEPGQSPSQETVPWAVVALEGEALDNIAVATFVVSLRDTALFRSVELKSSVSKKSTDGEFRSYSLECEI